jgi:two-component system, NarL family, sensor histidine kinase UhpB
MKQPLHILLVEDSPDDAELLLIQLRRRNYEPVSERVESATAMEAALAQKPWDIIVSDFIIPGFGGLQALDLFKQKRLDIPFIIVSGKIGEETAVAAMKAGAADYVMKDNLNRVVPAIERAIREAALLREKKRADDALRESEERFRELAEHIGDAFFVFERPTEDAPGRVSYVSPAFEKIWGLHPDVLESDAQAWIKTIHPLDRKHMIEKIANMRRGMFNDEFRILRGDMQTRWVQFRSFPVFNGQNEVKRIVGIAEDITERRYAQEQLEANARQFRDMVEELQVVEEELRASNEELFKAREELEQRVQERTMELTAANAELQRQMNERKRLENELLEIAENERRRIGFDLHDDLGQKLTGAMLMVKGVENKLAGKNAPEATDLRQVHGLLREVVDHTHDLAHYFSSLDFDGDDLCALLKRLAVNVKRIFNISCRVQIKGEVPALPATATMQLHKIAQEAVSNAIKHGKATGVSIGVSAANGKLILAVKNNGVPFPDVKNPTNRMGLRIMNYRASTINGALEIRRNGEEGTLVTCSVPLNGTQNGNGLHSTGLIPSALATLTTSPIAELVSS